MGKTFDEQKATILKKYRTIVDDPSLIELLDKVLKPCINCVAAKSPADAVNSKLGGPPLLPEDFELPTWEGQPLIFLAQIDFAEIQLEESFSQLPEKGLLSIFGYFKNKEGQLTIPEQDQKQLLGYYFADTEKLKVVKEESIQIASIKEVKLSFQLYADVPEFGDYRLPDHYVQIDPDFQLSWEIIPEVFGAEESPNMKLLGYPTDDALNTYPSWYIKDQGLEGKDYDLDSPAYLAEKPNYELLLWISILGMESLVLEDEYADFGGISIGIRRGDLEKRNFEKLLFKYSIS